MQDNQTEANNTVFMDDETDMVLNQSTMDDYTNNYNLDINEDIENKQYLANKND